MRLLSHTVDIMSYSYVSSILGVLKQCQQGQTGKGMHEVQKCYHFHCSILSLSYFPLSLRHDWLSLSGIVVTVSEHVHR